MLEIRETLAVVDDTSFYAAANFAARRENHSITCLRDLLEAAENFRFTHVWVMPGTNISSFSSVAWDIPGWDIVKIGKERIEFLSARRENARADSMIYVCFVEYSRWPWKGTLPNVTALIQTVAMLENALGEPLEWTPAHMSMRIVRRLNQSRWAWWQPMTLSLEEKGFSYENHVAKEIPWPGKGKEMVIPAGATHLIRIDGNSEYASAMTGLNIGEGNPRWTEESGIAYDGKRPGIWQVEIYEPKECLWDGLQLPALSGRQWATTDLIEQLRRMGYTVLIKSGWYWEKYHQSLRSTAEYLWAMRNNYRDFAEKSPAHANTYDTIRAVIKAIHGKMARADTEPHFRRRDVWAMVVARAVAMRLYKIEKIYREYGVLPVRIKADEFTYAVTDPHIFDNMLGTAKLGGFKLVSCEEIQRIS